MPARKSTIRAIHNHVSSLTSRSSASTSLPLNDGHSATDPSFSDDTAADTIAMRLMAVSLHDEGPDMDTMDTWLWKSREESLRDSRSQEVALDSPTEIPVDDIVSGVNKLCLRSPSPDRPPKLPRHKFAQSKRESNVCTKRVLVAFDAVEEKITNLSQALMEFMEALTHDKFDDMHATLSALHATMENNRRSTPSIDTKHTELVPCIRELENCLQKARLLLPEMDQPKEYPIGHHFVEPDVVSSTPVAQVALFLGVACSVMFGVSRRAGDFIMSMLSILLCLAFQKRDGSIDAAQENIRADIPHRIEEALKRFSLDGRTTTYAMCPSCHKGYAPMYNLQSTIPRYPDRCVNNILGHGICGEPLLSDNGPILPFVYQHLDDYIGKLLSQKETEQYLDSACDDLMDSIATNDQSTFIHDVFEADFMKTFKDPDGKKLFIDRAGECHLAFSLCVDYFNVGGLRKRGRSASSGIIALACLNLPIEIRYKPEYLYLCGVIPGPSAPHGPALNHYLTPLVDDLSTSWQKGVFYRQTALHSTGCIARAAVVCEVCDLGDAHQLAGLMQAKSHHFCSVCQLTGLANLGNCEKDTWLHRDVTEMRRIATLWQDAPTPEDRTKIYEEHGVAWSELYRLPYYDPTRQLVVDSMHCILEGLVHFHFRDVLKLTLADANAKVVATPAF